MRQWTPMQWCSKNKKSSNIYTNPPRESAGIKLPLVRRTFSRKTEETTEALITWIKSRTVLESSAENWILLRTWAVWCVTCNLSEDYRVKDREKLLNISCDPITDHAWRVCMYSWKKKKTNNNNEVVPYTIRPPNFFIQKHKKANHTLSFCFWLEILPKQNLIITQVLL